MVKPSHEINNGSLNKMGFIKVNNMWVSNDENSIGPSVGPSRNAGLMIRLNQVMVLQKTTQCMLLLVMSRL